MDHFLQRSQASDHDGSDQSAIRQHLTPALGHIQLTKLRQTDVQAFVATLARGVGPGTTRSVYGVLRAALNAAVNAELLTRSPARGIKLPQVPKTSRRTPCSRRRSASERTARLDVSRG
jgi:Phage integrase, N-terminal SAM-like domain